MCLSIYMCVRIYIYTRIVPKPTFNIIQISILHDSWKKSPPHEIMLRCIQKYLKRKLEPSLTLCKIAGGHWPGPVSWDMHPKIRLDALKSCLLEAGHSYNWTTPTDGNKDARFKLTNTNQAQVSPRLQHERSGGGFID